MDMERKDFTPALMSFLLLAGISILAGMRYWRMPDLWSGFPVNMVENADEGNR